MRTFRHMRRSVLTSGAVALFAAVLLAPLPAAAQENSVQKLLERGALQEAVERAGEERGNPEATFLAAFALTKMDNVDGASERYGQLREADNESWKAIGEAGAKLAARDVDGAMDAANRAVAADEGNAYAHYQLGIVATRQNNYQRALESFDKTIELKPDFAYAHYYAAQAAQRVKQTPLAVRHYTAFIKLAPDAPEKPAVQSLLRTLR